MKANLQHFKEAFDLVNNVPAGSFETSRIVWMETVSNQLELRLSGGMLARARCELREGADSKACVDRKYLGAFLSVANGEEVTLTNKEDKLLLSSGVHRATLPHIVVKAGYEEWRGKGERPELPSWLIRDLPLFGQYATSAPGSEQFSAVMLIEKWGVMASDGLAQVVVRSKRVPVKAAIPIEITARLSKKEKSSLVFDRDGVALSYGKLGYLYQPRNARVSKFPLEKLKELVVATMTDGVRPHLTFDLGILRSELEQLQKLSTFGGKSVASVTVTDREKRKISAVVEQEGFRAETMIRAKEVNGDFPGATWPLSKLLPWMAHVEGDKTLLRCGKKDYTTWFHCAEEDRSYTLIVVDVQ